MIRVSQSGVYLLATVVFVWGVGCRLKRPDTAPSRMIEPHLVEPKVSGPAPQPAKDPDATPIRLLDTQSLAPIGRRVLHQQANGELVEDPVWRWAAPPDRYLDTALRFEAASHPRLALVDSASATVLSATLMAWNLESDGGTRLKGEVQFQITGNDHVVHTQIVRASETVSDTLPGDLSAAAGRLLQRLASEGFKVTEKELLQPQSTASRR